MKQTGLVNTIHKKDITDNIEFLANKGEDWSVESIQIIWKLQYEITDFSLEIQSGLIEIAIAKISIFNNENNTTSTMDLSLAEYEKEVKVDSCKLFTIQSVSVDFKEKKIIAYV